MAKYILKSETQIGELSYEGAMTEEQLLKMIQLDEPDRYWQTCTKIPSRSHICKYCGGVADGANKDLLCKPCKDVFGHDLFSEL